MEKQWRHALREGKNNNHISHRQLQQLLEATINNKDWDTVERFLTPNLRHSVNPVERQGSAIACAAVLAKAQNLQLAKKCLPLVNWKDANSQAWLLRARIHQSLGEYGAAKKQLLRIHKDPETKSAATYRLGQISRACGEFNQAARWFLTSLECDPEPFHIHNELQFTNCDAKLLPRLIKFYEALILEQPEKAFPRQFLSHYLSKQGRLKRSILESKKAARLELGAITNQLAGMDQPPTPPDFVVIGVPKGGTTSLLHWLSHAPGLWCHPRKELHFFDGRFELGPDWYFSQFPRFKKDSGILRGEATPNYFSHPQAAERFSSLMPEAKAIILIRDPLQRAMSWVQHLIRLEGHEGSVSHWLEQELNQLEQLTPKEFALSPRVGTGALQDSCYDIHLRRWTSKVSPQQLLILSSEELFNHPKQQLKSVMSFLKHPATEMPVHALQPKNVNPEPRQELTGELQQRLEAFLRPYCEETLAKMSTKSALQD